MNSTELPPDDFLPDFSRPVSDCPHCSAGDTPKSDKPVPVRVLSIDGVPQMTGTYMMMRPSVLNKITQAFKGDGEREQ